MAFPILKRSIPRAISIAIEPIKLPCLKNRISSFSSGPGVLARALFNHINARIDGFCKFYNFKGFNLPEIHIDRQDALYSIESLVSAIRLTPYPVYLLIDEYDNFANTVMMGIHQDDIQYKALVHDQGPLRTFFKAIKASASGSIFDRIFITGVSPVVMGDITSGYNIAENIYFNPEFNDLCGFKKNEIQDVIMMAMLFPMHRMNTSITQLFVCIFSNLLKMAANIPGRCWMRTWPWMNQSLNILPRFPGEESF